MTGKREQEPPDQGVAGTAAGFAHDAGESLDVRGWFGYAVARLRQGFRRARGAFVPNAQAAVASTLGYVIASEGLRHQAPVFAPICAYICLGYTRNRPPRKVAELGAGATLGIGLGEVLGN